MPRLRHAGRPIEKHVDVDQVVVDKAEPGFECVFRSRQVGSANQDVDIARVSHRPA